jgi:hypothetical protein
VSAERVGRLRPTQVVARNLTVTRAWGLRIWSETDPHTGDHAWQAVSLWSYHEISRLGCRA